MRNDSGKGISDNDIQVVPDDTQTSDHPYSEAAASIARYFPDATQCVMTTQYQMPASTKRESRQFLGPNGYSNPFWKMVDTLLGPKKNSRPK